MPNRIREARKAVDMGQGELAKKVGVTQGAVSQWEKGRAEPSIWRLKLIAAVLNTTVDELLTDGKEAG